MFKNEKKERFSLRKYKDGRTDSKLIGATLLVGMGLLASGGTALANVSSNGTDIVTVVSDTSKVASTSATTFTDDISLKSVTVDAVLGKDVAEPTKANHNTGDVDGNDTLNFKTEATVNYKLESDKSLLKTETVEGEIGTVITPYDKKGITYDTDGKDYRESIETRTGSAITIETGKKDTVEVDGKTYKYIRSEVENIEKTLFDKTKFNDVEIAVSPKGLHNNLGEINYGKITDKVYLVEETSDGHYGKFVETSNITSDEEAVTAWESRQANAKDFTKENVTLQKGDTILVMDRDTYASGTTKNIESKNQFSRHKVDGNPEVISEKVSEDLGGYVTYAFYYFEKEVDKGSAIFNYKYWDFVGNKREVGEKNNGTAYQLAYYKGYDGFVPSVIPNFKRDTIQDYIEIVESQVLQVLEYFNRTEKNEVGQLEFKEKKAEMDKLIQDITNFITENNILVNSNESYYVNFHHDNREILEQLKLKLESGVKVIENMSVSLGTTTTLIQHNGKKGKLINDEKMTYVNSDSIAKCKANNCGIRKISTSTFYPELYTNWERVNSNEGTENLSHTSKDGVVVSDDLKNIKVTKVNSTTQEEEITKQETITEELSQYTVKEIITPIRAYQVMGDGRPVVNHYYELVVNKSNNPDNAPIQEIPEFTGGVASVDPPVNEKDEYRGGANSIEPPVLEIEKYPGNKEDAKLLEPPIYIKPTLITTKWVDENGTILKQADVKAPFELGESNKAFEHGTIEGYEYVETIRNQEEDIVIHVFRKLNSELKPESNPEPKPEQMPAPKTPKKEITPGQLGTLIQVKRLANTGSETSNVANTVGFAALVAGTALAVRKRQREE
ncbi:SIALI-17 repeat-containing surface protein [uncultured Gemella sp.]|uniref:SIALI-17 repeat-containing surface protein n=1 Tax=uncultured Gemella sp. TaxID=254352 RepID=UPI0028D54E3B|nr:SIALI-17 repeat-containing surface protein [uncultured Gemella sp.]